MFDIFIFHAPQSHAMKSGFMIFRQMKLLRHSRGFRWSTWFNSNARWCIWGPRAIHHESAYSSSSTFLNMQNDTASLAILINIDRRCFENDGHGIMSYFDDLLLSFYIRKMPAKPSTTPWKPIPPRRIPLFKWKRRLISLTHYAPWAQYTLKRPHSCHRWPIYWCDDATEFHININTLQCPRRNVNMPRPLASVCCKIFSPLLMPDCIVTHELSCWLV